LVNQYPQDFDASIPVYSIGIHPWFIVEDRLASDLDIVDKTARTQLSRGYGQTNANQLIRKQLVLAQKYNKPVVLRVAFEELIVPKKN
jgi:TatD DNase family protein